MNSAYKFLFGTLFILSFITILVTSILAYFTWGSIGLLVLVGTYIVIATVGGINAYKKRDVSVLGRVIRDEPIH